MDLIYKRIIDNCIRNADPREMRRLGTEAAQKKLMPKIIKLIAKVAMSRDMIEAEKRSKPIPT